MTNNEVLRRVRYALNLPDGLSKKIFGLGGLQVSEFELGEWFKKEEEPGFVPLSDGDLEAFLDGFILLRRGPRPADSPPPSSERLTNNVILKKLRIGLAWQETDVLKALGVGGLVVSTNELSALFRKPGQKNFRPCGDQLLRAFITGMTTDKTAN